MRILQIVHEHRVSMEVDETRGMGGDNGLTLEWLGRFLDEAVTEGAPEGAVTGFGYVNMNNPPGPEHMIVVWKDVRGVGETVTLDRRTGKRCTCGQDLDGTPIGRECCPAHGQTTTNHPGDEQSF